MYTPVNPSFAIYKGGLRGSKLYRYVFVMQRKKRVYFTPEDHKYYDLWSCQKVCEVFLNKTFISPDTKLYRQIVIIPMETNFRC